MEAVESAEEEAEQAVARKSKCGRGDRVEFCGAFGTKAKAERAERKHPGAFIKFQMMRHIGPRYLLLVARKKKR